MSGNSEFSHGVEVQRGRSDPRAVVLADRTRLTVLTPTLVRLEYAPDAHFEDRPSFFALHRDLAPPSFDVKRSGDQLSIRTPRIELQLHCGPGGFSASNLVIRVCRPGRPPAAWRPGDTNRGNLGGTLRTLDGARGPVRLDDGLLSRDGWYLIDDTRTPVFTPDWIEARPGDGRQDWYFFGYGSDYRAALRDLVAVSGPIPVPPSFVFGSWYSRYWPYSQEDFVRLVEEHHQHGFPLDVLVIDMDWHLPGWTGYTWNRDLIPDPDGLLRFLHERGVAVCLNLHPASGVHPHEEMYDAFARAVGADPASRQPVPFDCTAPRFMRAYFEVLHHPHERRGVDFWWLDWQQQTTSAIHRLDPLMWLNHLHFHHLRPIPNPHRPPTQPTRVSSEAECGREPLATPNRAPEEADSGTTRRSPGAPPRGSGPVTVQRPASDRLIFSRWGGWGGQRYPVQFSGDAESRWDVLAFEVQLTAAAGNAGCAYWSHDIGGHWSLDGRCDPELFTRWVQFGALSPVLRVHSTRDPANDRRAWLDGEPYLSAMRRAHLLRRALRPYLEKTALQCHDDGTPLCRPMYLDAPDTDDAYIARDQYLLGDDLIAAPVTAPGQGSPRFARVEAWLPPGKWTEWESGSTLAGPCWVACDVALAGMLIFERENAGVLPQDLRDGRNVRVIAEALDRRRLPAAPHPPENAAGASCYDAAQFLDDWRFIGPFEPQRDRPEIRAALELMLIPRPLPRVWRGPDDLQYDIRRYRTLAATVADSAHRLDHAVNLKAVFGEDESIGIAVCDLDADDGPVDLLLRHDDPVTLWVAGVEVYHADAVRPVYDPPVRIPAPNTAGARRIAILQKQFGRRWGFDLAVVRRAACRSSG